jgi:hypothetical protein
MWLDYQFFFAKIESEKTCIQKICIRLRVSAHWIIGDKNFCKIYGF